MQKHARVFLHCLFIDYELTDSIFQAIYSPSAQRTPTFHSLHARGLERLQRAPLYRRPAKETVQKTAMGDRYHSAQSPRNRERGLSDEKYAKLIQETSKGISSFNQLTRSMAQKMSLFNTPQDSRANHEALKELTDKGNKLVTKINRRLQELNKSSQGASARNRKTQVAKLSSDFKTQLRAFEETCAKLIESEKQSVDFIRRSSHSFNHNDAKAKVEFSNYNEDQIYAQANIIAYDEDGKRVKLCVSCMCNV